MVFNHALRADAERARRVLDWQDLGGLLVLNGLFVALAHSGLALLFWPLALFGVAGIIGKLFTIFPLVAATVLDYGRPQPCAAGSPDTGASGRVSGASG